MRATAAAESEPPPRTPPIYPRTAVRVGFENFDGRSVAAVRDALEGLGIGYGVQTDEPGRFYQYPGDPLATGIGTPVTHTTPA